MADIEKTEKTTPAYLRLYERLRREIVAGSYPYGSKMPSKRQLSEETGLSVVTVEHALALLCDEGYLESRERSGHYVLFRESDGFVPESVPARSAAPAHTGERTAFPFSLLAKTMRRVLSDYGEVLLERCPGPGTPELRQALSRYLARARGIRVSPEQIYVGAGSEYLYGLIVQVLGRERLYAVEDPSYEKIRQVYAAFGARTELLPLGADGITTQALQTARATVLHLTPYRSFPSDVTASAAKRREYIRWATREDRFLVEDDFTSEFSTSSKPEDTLFSLSERGNVIYMNTFSQTVAPSLRMGYLVLSEEMAELFSRRVGFYSCTVPVFEQFVLAEFIENGDYERHIRRSRRQLRRNLKAGR